MKKLTLLVIFLSVMACGVFAQKADIFTFSIGSGAGYNVNAQAVISETQFGMNYLFNDAFSGGFSFRNIIGTSVNLMNITIVPADKVSVSLLTGAIPAGSPAFGIGLAYDLFAKKAGLFAKMSVYADWLGTTAANSAFDVADGGVILFGFKTQVGL